MTDLLRFPHEAVAVIPDTHKHILHSMYEDSDLDGSRQAERLIDFLEQEAPGSFVGVLANSCYRPGCDTGQQSIFTVKSMTLPGRRSSSPNPSGSSMRNR